jgi:hypothetical protein
MCACILGLCTNQVHDFWGSIWKLVGSLGVQRLLMNNIVMIEKCWETDIIFP